MSRVSLVMGSERLMDGVELLAGDPGGALTHEVLQLAVALHRAHRR
jgi:hypothetical protein